MVLLPCFLTSWYLCSFFANGFRAILLIFRYVAYFSLKKKKKMFPKYPIVHRTFRPSLDMKIAYVVSEWNFWWEIWTANNMIKPDVFIGCWRFLLAWLSWIHCYITGSREKGTSESYSSFLHQDYWWEIQQFLKKETEGKYIHSFPIILF